MGWLQDAGNWVGNTAKGIGGSIVQGVKDVAGCGAQVVKATLDTGAWVLNGAGTAITDPAKFVKDCGDNINTYVGHVQDSFEKGAATIQEGWEQHEQGRSLWHALGATLDGVRQAGSMGLSDMWDDHLEEVLQEHTDELGNVIGYDTSEGTDYITKMIVRDHGDRWAFKKNGEDEIKEALDEGDVARARELDSALFAATTGKDIKEVCNTVATVGLAVTAVGGIIASPVTGGLSLGATGKAAVALAGKAAVAAGVTSVAANALDNERIKVNLLNVEDDIADAIAEQTAALQNAGLMDESQAEDYARVMEGYYNVTLYNGADPDYGVNQGFESNEAFRDWLLASNGLPTMSDIEGNGMSTQDIEAVHLETYSDVYGIPEEQAEAMAKAGALYQAGEIDEAGYFYGLYRVEASMLDMTEEQQDAYAVYASKLTTGDMSVERFQDAIANDEHLSQLILPDGTFDIRPKEGYEQAYENFGALVAGCDDGQEPADDTAYSRGADRDHGSDMIGVLPPNCREDDAGYGLA